MHGAWHGPWAWQRLIEQLPDVDVHTVALPSTGSDPAVLGNLDDDAAAVTWIRTSRSSPSHSFASSPSSR
ncbi:hypothetical protein [Pseudonocardia alaniniphila]|uniref:Alpha/beta hydrolase family protein n=1 Tax=Pseudonocardia alaniniphila TaxID=75291 RepID=A0ABS9T9A0_9PSEU|nr:hypothetical protein [Pseudonocardia alaniniphila]MCH6165108.1 hypothetical protein [Pseudonocardia alaniniphila]